MRKIFICLVVVACISMTAFGVSAKGNTEEDDWIIENPDAWEVVGEGEDIAFNCLESYADRILLDRPLDPLRGFYIQWDIGWNLPYEDMVDPSYDVQNATWSLNALGTDKEFRFMSRVKCLNGTFIMEISYHDGWNAQWVSVPIKLINSANANTGWKETDFSVRMIIWSGAGSDVLHFEARNTQNESVFAGKIEGSSMTTDHFLTHPLQFWMGGDGADTFNVANLTVLNEYDGKTTVPQSNMNLAYTTIPRVEVTVPALANNIDSAEKMKGGLSTVEIIAVTGGVVLVIASLAALLIATQKKTENPKKEEK